MTFDTVSNNTWHAWYTVSQTCILMLSKNQKTQKPNCPGEKSFPYENDITCYRQTFLHNPISLPMTTIVQSIYDQYYVFVIKISCTLIGVVTCAFYGSVFTFCGLYSCAHVPHHKQNCFGCWFLSLPRIQKTHFILFVYLSG